MAAIFLKKELQRIMEKADISVIITGFNTESYYSNNYEEYHLTSYNINRIIILKTEVN